MTAMRYYAMPVSWLDHGGHLLALSRTRRDWAVLNQTAAALVKACGSTGGTVEQVRSAFERRFGPVDDNDIETWLEALRTRGLLAHAPQDDGAVDPAGPDAAGSGNYSVIHAYVELLARCNLRCIHCFMGGAPERTEVLTIDEVWRVVRDLRDAGGRYVTLSGGEPLLHKDFEAIARFVVDLGLSGTVISNGTTLRSQALGLIDELGFNLAISLDGVSDAVNQQIRGISAARVIKVIDAALDRLGADRVTLSFTPVKANLDEVEPLLDFVEARGIRRVNISVYEEVGRASEHADDLTLTVEDRVRLMRILFTRAVALRGRAEIDLNDTRNILSQFVPDQREDAVHPLWRSVRVTSSGDVFPGSFGAVEQFSLGNIRRTPFRQLVESEALAELRDRLTGRVARTPECSACDWRQICRGGSVAAAFCDTGRIDAPDPHCAGYKAVFPDVALALADHVEASA